MGSRAVSDLEHIAAWAHSLLARLDPAEQRKVNRKVAADLRKAQARRIATQTNPDGSPYEPRKPRRASKKGSIRKRAMFSRLRTSKFLRTSATPTDLTVGFIGRAARIARVHQDGLTDRVDRGGKTIRYPQRVLLGLTDADLDAVQDSLLRHLAGNDT
jgi:phage virion morphogenesis protein